MTPRLGLQKRLFRQLWKELRQEPLKKGANFSTVLGVFVSIIGLTISNCHTTSQINIAKEQLELATRPYLHVVSSVWWAKKVLSGDIGTQVAITVKNAVEKPARTVHVMKDFMIRISAPKDKVRLEKMRMPSETFDQTQEAFWNEYVLYREQPIKDVAAFFRKEWTGQTEKEIEKLLNEKWVRETKEYHCEVYGSVEEWYVEPWVLASGDHTITLGRSTARRAEFFTEPGGDLLFVYLILGYRGLVKNTDYKLHYMGYFDSLSMREVRADIFPLTRYVAWDE